MSAEPPPPVDQLAEPAMDLRRRGRSVRQIAVELGVDEERARQALEAAATARFSKPDLTVWHDGLPTRLARALIAAGCKSRTDALAVTEPGAPVPGLTPDNLAAIRTWLGHPIDAARYTVSARDVVKALEVLRRAGYDLSEVKPPPEP